VIQKATYREILGLTEFTAAQVNLCATTGRNQQKDESEALPAVGHISGNKKTRTKLKFVLRQGHKTSRIYHFVRAYHNNEANNDSCGNSETGHNVNDDPLPKLLQSGN
jgi:hypothetical protein